MSSIGMSRRAMLKGATLAVAGAVLSACGATPRSSGSGTPNGSSARPMKPCGGPAAVGAR